MASPAPNEASGADSVQVPSTPPPMRARSAQSNATNPEKPAFTSPPVISTSMTPPPSSQPLRFHSPVNRAQVEELCASPTTTRLNASRNLPSADQIAKASIEELRTVAQDLVGALTDARMSAAHFKLQHNLLAMETDEAAQRAEIEHQMTRREVEVLQAADNRNRSNMSATPRASVTPSQSQIDALTKTCRALEDERDEAEDRLGKAKMLVELERDRAEILAEENLLLKKRIRENREHFTRLKDQSPIYTTPREAYTTPRRKSYSRFADDTPAHAPFAALIAADQILSQETASVPSTPTRSHAARFNSRMKQGHTRAAHSLSSLNTPSQARPLTADSFPTSQSLFSMPASQLVGESAERERHDRDSTISVSDAEDGDGDEVVQSQASSMATNMLRKNPGNQESIRLSQEAERSSNLLQSKLFGKVKPPNPHKLGRGKRVNDLDQDAMRSKKARYDESVGLGIEA